MKKTLLLFTTSFPYLKTREDTFLKYELPYLVSSFEAVVIIPISIGGEKQLLGNEIIVDETLAEFLRRNDSQSCKLLNWIDIKLIIKEVTNRPNIMVSPRKLYKLFQYICNMRKTFQWYKSSSYNKNKIVIYTYWFSFVTSSLSLYTSGKLPVISRIHSIDLYEERNKGYIALRKLSLDKIHKAYCISVAGVRYLREKYPEYSDKCVLARMGTRPLLVSKKSTRKDKKIFRIVSCSSIIPLKRVDLILNGVLDFSERKVTGIIEYIHFGDGPLRNKVTQIAATNNNPNLKIVLMGYVSNEQILQFYNDNYVDVFINASTVEGISVSMQEAQSCGIPCIGTNVGGTSEIINEHNGILLSGNPNKTEIADAIMEIYNRDKVHIESMRKNSYKHWKRNFNADINYQEFVSAIAIID